MAKEKGDWMQTMWRPAMGWLYMLVCFCDMIVFPVLWALWQGINHVPITQWNPLSLQGAGLFHIAMGAVLGIAAFGRTQEKLAGTAVNPATTGTTSAPVSAFGSTPSTGFGSTLTPTPTTSGFGSGFSANPVKPTVAVSSFTPAADPTAFDLHPDDPPTRNTRSDG